MKCEYGHDPVADPGAMCQSCEGILMTTPNPYCSEHEWPAGMPKPCPDCGQRAYFEGRIKTLVAERDAALLQNQELQKSLAWEMDVSKSRKTIADNLEKQLDNANRLLDGFQNRLRRAVNSLCSCGGKGPDDEDACNACEIWHEVMTTSERPISDAEARKIILDAGFKATPSEKRIEGGQNA